MVLLVCASLPTLGPLIRLVAGKIGASIDSSKDERSRGLDDSANTSGVRRNWENLKGHETDDPERGSAINASSVDDIPLVQKGQADGGIQKTTEFTLVTEHHRR